MAGVSEVLLIALVGAACPAGTIEGWSRLCSDFCGAREEIEGLGTRGGFGLGGMLLLFRRSAIGREIGDPGLFVLGAWDGLGGGSVAVLLGSSFCVAVEGGNAEGAPDCWVVVVSVAAPTTEHSSGGGVELIDFFLVRGFGTGDSSLSSCG